LENETLNEKFREYLRELNKSKKSWVKCYLKKNFTCGMASSSRIESKHRILKEYLNGNSRLGEIYSCFKNVEKQEIQKFTNEIQKFNLKENDILDQNELIKKSKEEYSDYVIQILKANILQAVNYTVNKQGNCW